MKTLIYISIIGVLFFGCKKEHRYEEDPKATHDTPQQRLNGTWKITSYTFNGQDIYTKLNQKATAQYNLNNIIFSYQYFSKKEDEANGSQGDGFKIYPIMTAQHRNFEDHTYLKINPPGCSNIEDSLLNYWFISSQTYCTSSTAYWRVTMLYKNDFHIVLNTDSGTYKIYLNKVKI